MLPSAAILLLRGTDRATCSTKLRGVTPMASVVRRGAKFHVKFHYQGSQYWRSLKTTDPEDARHARAAVERTIHLLETGALRVPAGPW